MSRIISLCTGVAVLLICFGCVHTQSGRAADTLVAVETVRTDAVCAGGSRSTSPKAVWIDTQQDLMVHWKRIHSHIRGGVTPPPVVEWDIHALLLVQMGQKSTAGYGLELAENRLRLQDGIASVTVRWTEPPAGVIAAQIITSPCIWLKMQRADYRALVVLDQSGQERVKVDVP